MERTCWRGATRVWPAATGSESVKAMACAFFNKIRLGAMSQSVQGCNRADEACKTTHKFPRRAWSLPVRSATSTLASLRSLHIPGLMAEGKKILSARAVCSPASLIVREDVFEVPVEWAPKWHADETGAFGHMCRVSTGALTSAWSPICKITQACQSNSAGIRHF
jgi:hypothetical protein